MPTLLAAAANSMEMELSAAGSQGAHTIARKKRRAAAEGDGLGAP